MTAKRALNLLLAAWTTVGLLGVSGIVVCGLREDWVGLGLSIFVADTAIFVLATGIWIPRHFRPREPA